MDPERPEVYERIPWETLEQKGGERQWLAYAVAAAVTLGALAYSFTRNQPIPPTTVETATPSTMAGPAPVASTTPATSPAVSTPMVVAEADLYAVDPERLIDQASSHAEWVAVEYVAMDGSEQSRQTLTALLPQGLPLPTAAQGVQVFVDWVRARNITQTGPAAFRVEVMVRSLASGEEKVFSRQPPRVVVIEVELAEDGSARVVDVPEMRSAPPSPTPDVALEQVPDEIIASLGDVEVVGGRQGEDGSWEVVVLQPDPDGVTRPVLIRP